MRLGLMILAGLAALTLGVVWRVSIYQECRDFGHTWHYCVAAATSR